MDENFWLQRWTNNEIAFHLKEANPLLVKYFKKLNLTPGQRVFIPLCGKTLDIAWILSQGFKVAGAEFSELAIEQLFFELGFKPQITQKKNLKLYSGPNIDIFVGDIFTLTQELVEPINAIYDRAAIVALPKDIRHRYAEHLMSLTKTAKQLLITFEYDQSLTHGPPFSVDDFEVRKHYGNAYRISLLESHELPKGLRGETPAKECVWILDSLN